MRKLFQKRTENSKENKIKKIIAITCGLCLSVFLVIAMCISAPGLISKGSKSSDNGEQELDFNEIGNNEIFLKIKECYLEYVNRVEKAIESEANDIQNDNMISHYDPVTDEITYTKPQIIKNINHIKPDIRLVCAYITTKYIDFETMEDNYTFNKHEINQFLDEITQKQSSWSGSDPIYYTASLHTKTVDEIKEQFFSESEYGENYLDKQEQYVIAVESFAFKEEEINSSYEEVDLSETTINPNGMKIPHYLQYASEWGKKKYGTGTISTSGCGPTCFAMVASYLTGVGYTPAVMAAWSEANGYYIYGVGTSWYFFQGASNKFGIRCKEIGKSAVKIAENLSDGNPVIVSMAPGLFTRYGHFIVLRGITKEGKVLVNDPNDNYDEKNFYKREFDIGFILSQAKSAWAFSK